MTVLLGPADLRQFALPPGQDGSLIAQYQLAQSMTPDQIMNDILNGISVANQSILSDPFIAGLLYPTTEISFEYGDGGRPRVQHTTEYGKTDSGRGSTVGHMLPTVGAEVGLGWTEQYLRKARSVSIDNDISVAIQELRDDLRKRLLRRFFSNVYNTVGTTGNGKDAPFVDGTTSDIAYAPPKFNGRSFTNTHSHFDRKATSARVDAIEAGVKHLWEHGIYTPYEAMIPEADISTWTALSGYIAPDRNITWRPTGTDNSSAAVAMFAGQDTDIIGGFNTDYGIVRLRSIPELPTNYLGVYKSYGALDPRNPLAGRFAQLYGAGIFMKASQIYNMPLVGASLVHEMGIGVGMGRLNGYACHFAASGNYVVPTIS